MKKQSKMLGFADSCPKSGGYQEVSPPGKDAQSMANSMINAHGGAAKAKKKSWPTHVGGKYAGT